MEPASAAALLLRSGLESGPKGGNANGVGEDDEMSDSPYEEEGSVEIVTELVSLLCTGILPILTFKQKQVT